MDNKHYVRTDANGYIIKSFSDAFEQPLTTDKFIEEGGRHYNLDLWDNGIPKFKYDIAIRPCTQPEIDAYKASLPVPIDPDADLAKAINNAVTVDDLKKALLGSLLTGQKGKVKGRA